MDTGSGFRDPTNAEDEQRQSRIDALGSLAHHQQSGMPISTSSARPTRAAPPASSAWLTTSRRTQPTRGRAWKRAILASLVVVLVATGGVAFYVTHRKVPTSEHQARPIQIAVTTDRFDCPHDVAWAPDGGTIALLGYQHDCPYLASPVASQNGHGLSHTPGLVDLYETHHGSLVSQIHPDDMILPAIKIPPAVTAYAQSQYNTLGITINYFDIDYTHVLWSSDGKHLAITFMAAVPTGTPAKDSNGFASWPLQIVDGVLLTAPDGTSPQVFVQDRGNNGAYTTWDLAAGKAVPTSAEMAPTSPLATILPAASFHWGPDGSLVPDGPLPPVGARPPMAPVGNPSGGSTFSLWQPGVAAGAITAAGLSPLQQVFTWTTNIAAWSPDGRFLAENIALVGLLISPCSVPRKLDRPIR